MKATLQRVFEQGFDAYARSRRLPKHVHQAARAIRRCRTGALGGHVLRCAAGHIAGVWYNSCRHRACPQCAYLQTERWLDGWKARLLDCDHYHVIFTVPHELTPLWHTNRRGMSDLLFRCVRETLLELLGDERYLGAQPGILATLHTWGRTLLFHPHVHCLVTGGGWARGEWRAVTSGYLLPVRVVKALFRGKLLAALRQSLAAERLALPPGMSRTRLENLLRRLGQRRWNVCIQERYAHGRGVLTYLARYVRGGPLSNRQLLHVGDARVVFRYTDHRDHCAKSMALPLLHFLQRLVWHIPEPRTHAVRPWGLYARSKHPARDACRKALGPTDPPASPRRSGEAPPRRSPPPERDCPLCGRPLVPHPFARSRAPPAFPGVVVRA